MNEITRTRKPTRPQTKRIIPIDGMRVEVHHDTSSTTRQMSQQWQRRHRLFISYVIIVREKEKERQRENN